MYIYFYSKYLSPRHYHLSLALDNRIRNRDISNLAFKLKSFLKNEKTSFLIKGDLFAFLIVSLPRLPSIFFSENSHMIFNQHMTSERVR